MVQAMTPGGIMVTSADVNDSLSSNPLLHQYYMPAYLLKANAR